ncbi:Flagellar motor switch protein FliM [Candidatus Trichorickettsia mobilis]|uniref:Flagellar motor switch protein FliM n=1 Tax=Candidatus Trichorickettsia mobilis TaxID=1346319 RepID=A0ABZ0UU26_9RICK|nr:flagellar motor switch protein FliM [Candidatus Trichorickettsia mobilis]WPY00597.1 Flagellar motor switch protein FliM [Candidatus Trichorickettsia mobilis]
MSSDNIENNPNNLNREREPVTHSLLSTGVKAVLDQALQSYERLPMLEIVFEKFSQHLATAFRHLTSEAVDVEIVSFDSLRFGEYFKTMKAPLPIVVFKAIEWENLGLLILDDNLVFTFIDILLGGKKNATAQVKREASRGLTSIEQGIVKQISEIVLTELGHAFEPVSSTTFSLERLETNPNFATITRPGDAIIVLKIKIEIENRAVYMDLVIPYKTIEPIKEQLQQVFFGDKFGNDIVWEEMIFNAIYQIDLPIEAVIINKPTPLYEVINLKIGDTIVIDHVQHEDILIRSGHIALFKGQIGKVENKVAVSITKYY